MEQNKNKTFHWEPDAEITITGLQYAVFQKFAAMFSPLVKTNAEIWDSMIDKGLVKDEDDNVVKREDGEKGAI